MPPKDEDGQFKRWYNQVVYQGFRPDNSFIMHDQFTGENSYMFRFSSVLMSNYKKFLSYMNEDDVNMRRPF